MARVKRLSNEEMEEKARRYRDINREMDELQEEKATLADEMKAELKRRGVEDLTVGPYKVSNHGVITSRFDTTSFKKANPSIYEMYLVESSGTRFSVK